MHPTYAAGASPWAVTEVKEAISSFFIPITILGDYQQNITRAEFCSLLFTMLRDKVTGTEKEKDFFDIVFSMIDETPFDDTIDFHVISAYHLGIVNGTGYREFSPDRHITRQEAAVMLARAASVLDFVEYSDPPVFSDEDITADWAKDAIRFISANGIMNDFHLRQ